MQPLVRRRPVLAILLCQHWTGRSRPTAGGGITMTCAASRSCFSYSTAGPFATDASSLCHLWFDVGARLKRDMNLYRLLFAHIGSPFDIDRSRILSP